MKRHRQLMWSTFPLVLVVFLLADAGNAGEFAWRKHPGLAQREARQSARPILVYVGGKSCVHCRRLEKTTWPDPQVTQLVATKYVALHVDGQRDVELSQQLGVRALPTMVLLTPDGKLIDRAEGFLSPQQMYHFLSRRLVAQQQQLVP